MIENRLMNRTALIALGALLIVACGGGGSSSAPVIVTPPPPPPPPSNTVPSAVITADKTLIEERDSFSLSAASSSDADDDTLTYSWSQTRGPTVAITDTSAEVLNLTMPEADADVIVTFKLDVTDGTDTATTSIDVTLDNITVFPADTKFTKRDNSGLIAVENPLSFFDVTNTDLATREQSLRGFVGTSRRDSGQAILSGWTVRVSSTQPEWQAPDFSIELPGITIGPDEKPEFMMFTLSSQFVFPFGTSNTEWYGVFFDQSDKMLVSPNNMAAPSTTNTLNLPGACSADIVLDGSDSNGAFVTYGDVAGGLWRLPIDPGGASGTVSAGTAIKIEPTGNYCDMVQDLAGNVVTVDDTNRTIDVRTFNGTKMSVALDAGGSNGLNVLNYQIQRGTEYTNPADPSYLFVLLSDELADGKSQINIYELARSGMTRYLSSYELVRGVPEEISFSLPLRNGAIPNALRMRNAPYIVTLLCYKSLPEYCTSYQYLDVGFDKTDLTVLGGSLARELLVSETNADEMELWTLD